jgi:hypothetical protein
VLGKKVLIHRGDDVHHGIADGDGMQRGRFHDPTTLDVAQVGQPASEPQKKVELARHPTTSRTKLGSRNTKL